MAAAREAIVNAAKFAGGASRSTSTPRSTPARVEVFVRDRGAGFDPGRGARTTAAACASRSSAGWSATAARATIHSRPGDGTEVELVMEASA